jgi:thermostable 8-oxoguanine DNA glycosylase
MIDPINITKFDNTKEQLEEVLLFWVLAAGKNATTACRCLDNLLINIHNKFNINPYRPFECLGKFEKSELADLLKSHGIGCYNNKSKTIYELVNSNLDLQECSAEDLEKIYGIGMKTSRCFIIHSRKDASYAGLDVHILHFLKDLGYNVPNQTPIRKQYLEIEKIFLDIVRKSDMSVAEYDLMIWNKYSGRNKNDTKRNSPKSEGRKSKSLVG